MIMALCSTVVSKTLYVNFNRNLVVFVILPSLPILKLVALFFKRALLMLAFSFSDLFLIQFPTWIHDLFILILCPPIMDRDGVQPLIQSQGSWLLRLLCDHQPPTRLLSTGGWCQSSKRPSLSRRCDEHERLNDSNIHHLFTRLSTSTRHLE